MCEAKGGRERRQGGERRKEAGQGDYPSKGHKAFRLSFRAGTMATESVWISFFRISQILGAQLIGHSDYCPFKVMQV